MSATARRYDTYAELRFTYSPGAVEALKYAVPYYARQWHPTTKTWDVDEPYVDAAIAAIRPHAGAPRIDDRRRTKPTPAPRAVGCDWAEATHDALPEHLRQPVYLALVRVLHPDLGGDPRLTQQLNDAFTGKAAS